MRRRTPRGVRGLKLVNGGGKEARTNSRTPRGVRGLKFYSPEFDRFGVMTRRTPRGVRGLKYDFVPVSDVDYYVAPLAGCVD